MSTLITPTTGWQWPADVVEIAKGYNVESYLDPLLVALRQAFPDARGLRVFAEPDVAILDHYFVVFEVRITSTADADFLAGWERWRELLRRVCSGAGAHPFCLSLLPENA